MASRCDCSYCDGRKHKDFHGYQIGDDEEVNYKKPSKVKSKKRYKGCPERNHGAHIYVWVEFFGKEYRYRRENDSLIQKKADVHWYDRLCIGCGHRNNRRYDWGFEWRPIQNSDGIEVYEVRHVDYGPSW